MNPLDEKFELEERLAHAYAELQTSFDTIHADKCFQKITKIEDEIDNWWGDYGDEYGAVLI